MNNTFRISALICSAAALVSNAGPVAARPAQEVKLYLVAVGDAGKIGRKFGCDDSLVPVVRTIPTTAAPLTAAINELLETPHEDSANPKLSNFWRGPELKLKSVSVRRGTATIHFSGHVAIAGVCDQPRIEEQIEATARQFPNVKRVKVFVGGEALADALR